MSLSVRDNVKLIKSPGRATQLLSQAVFGKFGGDPFGAIETFIGVF